MQLSPGDLVKGEIVSVEGCWCIRLARKFVRGFPMLLIVAAIYGASVPIVGFKYFMNRGRRGRGESRRFRQQGGWLRAAVA